MSIPLPSQHDDPYAIGAWAERIFLLGDRSVSGWRYRAVGCKTLEELVEDMRRGPAGRWKEISVNIRPDDFIALNARIQASGLPRAQWVRRAIAYYLVHAEGLDPDDIGEMVEDLLKENSPS